MDDGTANSDCNLWMDRDSAYSINYSPTELKQLLLYAAMELDSVRASAQTQMQLQRAQIEHLEELLDAARRERDEIREQCDRFNSKLTNYQTSYDDNARHQQSNLHLIFKSLPEKGKLLEAVMQAGPLLQTLLVAGPLPQWRYPPPPPLQSIEIPPLCTPIIRSGPTLGYDCYFCSNPGLLPPFPNRGELGHCSCYDYNQAALNPGTIVHGDPLNVYSRNNAMDCIGPARTSEEYLITDYDKHIVTPLTIKPELGCNVIESQPGKNFGPRRPHGVPTVSPSYASPMSWNPDFSSPF